MRLTILWLCRKNGHEVLAEIKIHATLSRIPIAVITTSSNEEDIARVYRQQAQFYLVKPVTLEQLAKILNDIG